LKYYVHSCMLSEAQNAILLLVSLSLASCDGALQVQGRVVAR
jgi:hypothetical protein